MKTGLHLQPENGLTGVWSFNFKKKKMKKVLLLVVVALTAVAVKAQDVYLGGSMNLWRNSTGNTTSFKIAPEIGYNFNETWALAAELGYSHEYVEGVALNTFVVAPYLRWSYYRNDRVRLFLDGTAAIGFVKVKDGDSSKAGQIGLRPGIAVKLNDRFSFVAKYGFLGYRRNMVTSGDSFGLNLSSEDLSIGFHYEF
jgi:hypothetical protein